jgi:hypothetical protein
MKAAPAVLPNPSLDQSFSAALSEGAKQAAFRTGCAESVTEALQFRSFSAKAGAL